MKYRITPDNADHVTANVVEAIRSVLDAGHPAAVEVKRWRPTRTPAQHRTLWMWCSEVASQLTEQCRQNGIRAGWTKGDVYEVIVKPRFMPRRECVMPDGSTEERPMGLSDPDLALTLLSRAMDQFLAWIVAQGMEVTVPDDPLLEQVGAA